MIKLVTLKEKHELNIVNKIYDFKNPSKIYIPIYTDTTFKMNDYIYKNTYFGDYTTSISGYIKGSKEIIVSNKKITAIEIDNDFKENVSNRKRKKKITSKEALINILDEYNLKYISNKLKEINNINNIIVVSIDEESYSVKELMRLSHNYPEILETFDFLLNILNLSQGILATKNTNFKSIKNVKSIIGTYPNIKISLLPDKYLISYKEFICECLNQKKEETLLLATNEMYAIYNVIKKAKDITEQLITISGNAIKKSLVINIRIGTLLEEVIKEFIEIIDNNYEIYINGYLQGIKISDVSKVIIDRNIDSVIINKMEEDNETECINCGACKKICPFNINVKNCYFDKMKHKNCIGCGLCNYICPAKINLKKVVWGRKYEK